MLRFRVTTRSQRSISGGDRRRRDYRARPLESFEAETAIGQLWEINGKFGIAK